MINCIIFIPNFGLLIFCRIVQGICAGLYSSITPLIIKEVVPFEVSGTLGAFSEMFINIGIVIGFFLQFLIILGIAQNQGSID